MWPYIEQPEIQNRSLDLMGLAKPGKTRGLTGMGLGLDPQEVVGRVFGRFWNWAEQFSLAKPGPVSNITCKEEADILLLISVLIIIITFIEYIRIIFWDCLWFPSRLVEDMFDNEYDIVLFVLSSLREEYKKEDRLFAAQCIWWLAGIIQYTELWIFYRHHR